MASRAVVISGAPGTGKSRLAAEYAHSRGGHGFWTDAGNTVSETLAALAPSLDVETGNRNVDEIASNIERALVQEPSETLWVIDNLTDLSLVNGILGKVGDVQLLVTTRDARKELLPGTVRVVELGGLKPDSAVALLTSRSERDLADPALGELSQAVGYLPLALEILAVRLREPTQSPEKLLTDLQRVATETGTEARGEASKATTSEADAVNDAIVSSLAAYEQGTRTMLAPLGYLADAPIPKALLLAVTDSDEERLGLLLEELGDQSILSEQDGEFVVHSLTAAAIAATNEAGALEMTIERANGRLAQISTDDPVALRMDLDHYERLRERAVKTMGAEEPSTLRFTNNLAVGYQLLGRYGESAALNKDTLAVREHVLGPDHPETLTSRNNLAIVYRDLGRYEEATALDQETLAVRERVLGPDNLYTLNSRNNLAADYSELGRREEALELFKETLAVRHRVFGPEHADTLDTRNNLAKAYLDLGQNEEAVKLFEETLTARKRVQGPEHPATLSSLNNLAGAYRRLGRSEEAVAMDEETLAARERLLGDDHPETLHSRTNLAIGYQMLRRGEDAVALGAETLVASERVLGREHPDTLLSRNNLAVVYRELGRNEEAVALDEETLAARERVLGTEHPDTLQSRTNLAADYRALGRDVEADALEGKAKAPRLLPRRKKKAGAKAKAPSKARRKPKAARRKPPRKKQA